MCSALYSNAPGYFRLTVTPHGGPQAIQTRYPIYFAVKHRSARRFAVAARPQAVETRRNA